MGVLHVATPGLKVHKRGGQVQVVRPSDGSVVARLPIEQLKALVLHPGAETTTRLLYTLLRNACPVFFIDRDKVWVLSSGTHPGAAQLIQQVERSKDPAFRLNMARFFVEAKLRSQATYLELRARRSTVRREGCAEIHREATKALLMRAEEAHGVQSIGKLRGIEGAASALYFRALACGWQRYGFRGRRRNPPTDLVNAALSYGYALLRAEVIRALIQAELHIELGLYHETQRGNPSLALDLMEEFRVVAVDALVGRLVGGHRLGQKHIRPEGEGVFLNDEGRKILTQAFTARMEEQFILPEGRKERLQDIVQAQAQSIRDAIIHEKPYRPYHWELGGSS